MDNKSTMVNKSTMGNRNVPQATGKKTNHSTQNFDYDYDNNKNFTKRKNVTRTYDHRQDQAIGDKLAKTSYDQFFMVNKHGWSRSKETYRNQRKFKSDDYAEEFYDRLAYQAIKSPSYKSNQRSTFQAGDSKANTSQMQGSYYWNMKNLGGTQGPSNRDNSQMSSHRKLDQTNGSMGYKGRGSGSGMTNKSINGKSTISGRASKMSWLKKDHNFSFHPSIRHDKSYDSSTPYEKSLSRIREKYSRDKESIYGVNLDNKLYTNRGITEIERIKQKSKPATHKTQNRRIEKLQLDNQFSKLIALASLFSCGSPTIKISNIDRLLQSQMGKHQPLSPTDLNASNSTILSGNRNMNTIITSIAMSQIYEITPFDFIEFIKNKNLTEEAAKAYEFLMANQINENSEKLERSNGDNIDVLRSVEFGSKRDTCGVWSGCGGSSNFDCKNFFGVGKFLEWGFGIRFWEACGILG
jgi:hypothetical protein